MSERALHIPPAILALPELPLLACAVLAEVLDLYRVSGQVFASDEHFAERCHSKPRTVRETIAELVAAGHLVREVNYAARHKRLLTPAEQWRNPPGVVADSATTSELVADSTGSSGEIRRDLWRNPPGVVADSANINTIVNNKEEGSAADAATPASSLSENSQPAPPPTSPPARPASKKAKPAGATPDEVAALSLPHASSAFGQLWATFRAGPQHAKKALSAFQMMLNKLAKYPEGFAIVMLESAIERTWSGIENPGTARSYAEWQAEQARAQPTPALATSHPLTPALNEQVMAERAAQAKERQRQHLARHSLPTSSQPIAP